MVILIDFPVLRCLFLAFIEIQYRIFRSINSQWWGSFLESMVKILSSFCQVLFGIFGGFCYF